MVITRINCWVLWHYDMKKWRAHIWSHERHHNYLILVHLSSQPLYILGCLADLGSQTGRVSHLRIFLINIFHLPQGLTEERQERARTREERNKRGRGKVTFSREPVPCRAQGWVNNSNTHRGTTELYTLLCAAWMLYPTTPPPALPTRAVLTGMVINTQKNSHIHTQTHTSGLLPFAIPCKFRLVSVEASSCAAQEEDVRSPPSLWAVKGHRKGGLTLSSLLLYKQQFQSNNNHINRWCRLRKSSVWFVFSSRNDIWLMFFRTLLHIS